MKTGTMQPKPALPDITRLAFALAMAMYRCGYDEGIADGKRPFMRQRRPVKFNLKQLDKAQKAFAKATGLSLREVREGVLDERAVEDDHAPAR